MTLFLRALHYIEPFSRHQLHAEIYNLLCKCKAMKWNAFLIQWRPLTKTLLRAELKGISGALQMIVYRRPSGRTTLQCIMLQSHIHYTYQINVKLNKFLETHIWRSNPYLVITHTVILKNSTILVIISIFYQLIQNKYQVYIFFHFQ